MPQVFKIGSYIIFFWINENDPLEPIHVHVAEKRPEKNATKIWITKAGKALIAHNHSQIPQNKLNTICEIIESRSKEIIENWGYHFHEISYYC